MKKLVTAVAMLLLGVGAASAANLYTSGVVGTSGSYTPALTPVSITQNLDTSVLEAAMVHCGTPDGVHTDNSHLRRFQLFNDHSIIGNFDVLSVDYGVEEASSILGSPTQPIDMNLYSIGSGSPFTFANLTLIGSMTHQIPNDGSATLAFFNSGVTGTIANPTTTDLVVEMFTPDGVAGGNSLWPGGNTRGQIRPTYIAAADCAITEPTDLAAIGFPTAHLFFVVNGDENGGIPTEETDWSNLKSLYR